MCEICCQNSVHRLGPSRRSLLLLAASAAGMALASPAIAKKTKAPPKPQNVVSPEASLERLRREYDAIGFFLSGHPLDDYATVLKRLRVQSWAEFSRAVKTGATAGKVAATVVSRMERRTKTGNKMGIIGLSDPTGHFEAVLFSEGLAQYREVLEPGAAVLLQLGAELQGEDVRARVLHAEPLDAAAAKTQKGLRIFVRDTRSLESIARRRCPRPAGEASCCGRRRR